MDARFTMYYYKEGGMYLINSKRDSGYFLFESPMLLKCYLAIFLKFQ